MDPLTIYLMIFIGAIAVCAGALIVKAGQTRACPDCRGDMPVTARACRACGYRV